MSELAMQSAREHGCTGRINGTQTEIFVGQLYIMCGLKERNDLSDN